MIVEIILDENGSKKPNLPDGYGYTGWDDIGNGTCKVHGVIIPEHINGVPVTITSFQGKEHLRNIGKYDEVVTILNEMVKNNHPLGNTYKNAFDNIQNWQRSSVTIQNMAGSIGIVGAGLDNFFIEAKKIELP